ncbi:hypothetical protein COOONC_04961 [Cooperia oncophora]
MHGAAHTWITGSSISCLHRHAVKILNQDTLSVETVETAGYNISRNCLLRPPLEADSDAPITVAQERREARYQKLSAIKSTYAVVEAAATSLAKVDTDEAMEQLEEILCYLQLAAGIAQPPSSSSLAVLPELAQIGGKPQLTKAKLSISAVNQMPERN